VTTTASEFLAAILPAPGEKERIELRAFTTDGDRVRNFHSTVGELLTEAERLADTHNVYYGMALRQFDDAGEIAGDRKHVSHYQSFWSDVDGKCYADGKDGALRAIRAFPLPPSAIIDSGNG
jgi:hypothetical protein